MCRMNSGTVSSRALASAVQGMRPAAIAPAASCRPASPPIRPIIWLLNWVRRSSVISRYPSSRAFFSASRLTMPRRKAGARSIRWSAPSVHRISASPGSCWVLVSNSATAILFIDDFLEFLAGLEERHALGGDGDRRAGLWIAAFLHAAVPQAKAPEAADFDLVALGQRRPDAVEDCVDHDFGLSFGQRVDLLGQFLNELRFCHGSFPPKPPTCTSG